MVEIISFYSVLSAASVEFFFHFKFDITTSINLFDLSETRKIINDYDGGGKKIEKIVRT